MITANDKINQTYNYYYQKLMDKKKTQQIQEKINSEKKINADSDAPAALSKVNIDEFKKKIQSIIPDNVSIPDPEQKKLENDYKNLFSDLKDKGINTALFSEATMSMVIYGKMNQLGDFYKSTADLLQNGNYTSKDMENFFVSVNNMAANYGNKVIESFFKLYNDSSDTMISKTDYSSKLFSMTKKMSSAPDNANIMAAVFDTSEALIKKGAADILDYFLTSVETNYTYPNYKLTAPQLGYTLQHFTAEDTETAKKLISSVEKFSKDPLMDINVTNEYLEQMRGWKKQGLDIEKIQSVVSNIGNRDVDEFMVALQNVQNNNSSQVDKFLDISKKVGQYEKNTGIISTQTFFANVAALSSNKSSGLGNYLTNVETFLNNKNNPVNINSLSADFTSTTQEILPNSGLAIMGMTSYINGGSTEAHAWTVSLGWQAESSSQSTFTRNIEIVQNPFKEVRENTKADVSLTVNYNSLIHGINASEIAQTLATGGLKAVATETAKALVKEGARFVINKIMSQNEKQIEDFAKKYNLSKEDIMNLGDEFFGLNEKYDTLKKDIISWGVQAGEQLINSNKAGSKTGNFDFSGVNIDLSKGYKDLNEGSGTKLAVDAIYGLLNKGISASSNLSLSINDAQGNEVNKVNITKIGAYNLTFGIINSQNGTKNLDFNLPINSTGTTFYKLTLKAEASSSTNTTGYSSSEIKGSISQIEVNLENGGKYGLYDTAEMNKILTYSDTLPEDINFKDTGRNKSMYDKLVYKFGNQNNNHLINVAEAEKSLSDMTKLITATQSYDILKQSANMANGSILNLLR